MDNYSLPRRIWRIIYPVLIFLAIQIFVGLLVSVVVSVAFGLQAAFGGDAFDASALADAVTRYLGESAIMVLLASNLVSLAVFLPMWLAARKKSEPYMNRSPAALGLLVIGFFACFNIVQMFIFGVTDIMRFFPSYDEVVDVFEGGSILLQVVTVGVLAPVVEELLFRGLLMSRMKWLPAWAAVALQAVIFGAVHLNWFQSLYALLAGVLLGMVYVKYKSIILTMLAHIAYNLASVLLGEFMDDTVAMVVLLVCPVVTVVFGVLLLTRHRAVKRYAEPPLPMY